MPRAILASLMMCCLAFQCAASETAEGLFNLPEHLEKLKLDKPGSNGSIAWGIAK